ncbi:MAG: hypothetical protein U5J63_12400 [Fodinibius sp.]|nr:hypothetical protein [Fodinibius sp.]
MQKIDDRDRIEATAKPLFKQMITLFQMALLVKERTSAESRRFELALQYLADSFDHRIRERQPADLEQIDELLGWSY